VPSAAAAAGVTLNRDWLLSEEGRLLIYFMLSSAVCPNAPTFATTKKIFGLTLRVLTDRTCQVNTNNLAAGCKQAGKL